MFEGPFRGSVAVAAGLLSKDHLRGPRFRRLFPDIYAPATLDVDLALLSRAAHLLVESEGGVLAGYSAALLLGADCAPRGTRAEVLTPTSRPSGPRLLVHRGTAATEDRCTVGGCRVTGPEQTAWDLARRLRLVEAVVVVDAIGRRFRHREPRFVPTDLLLRREREPGARGSRSLDRVVEMADGKAESPMETRLRLLLVLAGLPVPEVQFELVNRWGMVAARFDLAYPAARLAIEYDGLGHRRREFGAEGSLAGPSVVAIQPPWSVSGASGAAWPVGRPSRVSGLILPVMW